MTTPLTDALASLVASALPWRRLLGLDKPAPYPDHILNEMITQEALDAPT